MHKIQPKLLYGPYSPPACRLGDTLACERMGRDIVVGGLSDAPIQWPYAKKAGKRSLILCGDLVRAVLRESAQAIRYHWGVSAVTVWHWRKSLGVPSRTEGTRQLNREMIGAHFSAEQAARGRMLARSSEARDKLRKARLGKRAHPNTRRALLQAARRPKSIRWRYERSIATGATRREAIIRLRRRGLTLSEIGAAIGLTRQRIHQLSIGCGGHWRRRKRQRSKEEKMKRNEKKMRDKAAQRLARNMELSANGAAVLEIRLRARLSQQAFAARIGLSQSRIATIEQCGCSLLVRHRIEQICGSAADPARLLTPNAARAAGRNA